MKKRILIVNSDERRADLLAPLLRDCHVHVATDEVRAMSLIDSVEYDAVALDASIPVREFITQRRVPLVLMSDRSADEIADEILRVIA